MSLSALHCMHFGKPRLRFVGNIFVEVSLPTNILPYENYPLYSIRNHIPATFGCHGNVFGYVEAQLFTCTIHHNFLKINVKIFLYSITLCTNAHKFGIFYSIDCTLLIEYCHMHNAICTRVISLKYSLYIR